MPDPTKFVSFTPPPYWGQACRELSRACPVMKKIIRTYGTQGSLASRGDAFYTMLRSITGQQISVKAADTIWGRLMTLVDPFTPEMLLSKTDEALRGVGFSGSKVKYARVVARHLSDNPTAGADWTAMEPEAAIRSMTALSGIGRWTAEMMLIFHQMRPDVFPLGDIGLRNAIYKHYNSGEKLSMAELEAIGQTLAPWRTVATWYFWRSLDPVPVEY